MTLVFGTGLPFGPPGNDRYKDILRSPTYRRVDIGFSKILIDEDKPNTSRLAVVNKLKSKNILACSQKLQTSTVKNNSSLLNKD